MNEYILYLLYEHLEILSMFEITKISKNFRNYFSDDKEIINIFSSFRIQNIYLLKIKEYLKNVASKRAKIIELNMIYEYFISHPSKQLKAGDVLKLNHDLYIYDGRDSFDDINYIYLGPRRKYLLIDMIKEDLPFSYWSEVSCYKDICFDYRPYKNQIIENMKDDKSYFIFDGLVFFLDVKSGKLKNLGSSWMIEKFCDQSYGRFSYVKGRNKYLDCFSLMLINQLF